jgi:RNA polymerase sigma factor (sigma-70 family)
VDAENSAAQVVATHRRHRGAPTSTSPEEFFRKHYRELIRTTMLFGADEEQAKDAVSSALVDLVGSWNRVDAPADDPLKIDDPLKWAYRAATRHFLKEKQRGLGRIRTRLVEKCVGTGEGDDGQLAVWEDEHWVAQVLSSLPPKQAETMAFVIKGFTPSEIAELLGRTPEAVRQNLLEARRRLRQSIRDEQTSVQQPGSSGSSFKRKAQ